jgi:hypothetical protein
MLKFRALTPEELTELETEFKQFLIINELYDAEWRDLATKDPQKAQEFIDMFANIVLEKVYNKQPGLLQIGNDFITVFDFQDDVWNFFHFQTTDTKLFADCSPENFLTLLQNAWEQLSLHKGSKKSSEHKAEEIYSLICKGALPLHKASLQDFLKLISAN